MPNRYTSNVDFNIPDIQSKPGPYGMSNLMTIIAPGQVLDQKQQDQVLKLVADVQLKENLAPVLREHAISQMDQFQKESMEMLKQNKGLNRLTFTPQQQAELRTKKQRMLQDIGWVTTLQSGYDKVIGKAANAMYQGTLDKDGADYIASWPQRTADMIKNGGSFDQVTNPESEFVSVLKNREASQADKYRFFNELSKEFKLFNYSQGGQKDRSEVEILANINSYYPKGSMAWEAKDAQLTKFGYWPDEMINADEDAKKAYLVKQSKAGFNPYEQHYNQYQYTPGTARNPMENTPVQQPDGSYLWPKGSSKLTWSGQLSDGRNVDNADVIAVKGSTPNAPETAIIQYTVRGLGGMPPSIRQKEVPYDNSIKIASEKAGIKDVPGSGAAPKKSSGPVLVSTSGKEYDEAGVKLAWIKRNQRTPTDKEWEAWKKEKGLTIKQTK